MARVLIRTRPLSQGNYGGILQAYALQRSVESLGHEAVTDVSTGIDSASVASLLKLNVKSAAVRLGLPLGQRAAWVEAYLRKTRDAELTRFVAQFIKTTELYDASGNIRQEVLAAAQTFLVGSDQVWRGEFGRVPSYFFDFLPTSDQRPRVAYAASFGTDNLQEYNNELLSKTRELASQFSAISVRESSGIQLCHDILRVDAEHVLDPTMLLPKSHYVGLARGRTAFTDPGTLVTYVLDKSPEIERQILELTQRLKLKQSSLLPRHPATLKAYNQAPSEFSRPGVEQWLESINSAQLLVTDSFHGTVFAILFQTPFITITNHSRGAARFNSLLKMFGLEDRLVLPGKKVPAGLLEKCIDWEEVSKLLERERATSTLFLDKALA